MRGFLSAVLGLAMLLIILPSYKAWMNTKDLYSGVPAYMKMLDDSYRRSDLERDVYTTMKDVALFCSTGTMDLHQCQVYANNKVVGLLTRWSDYVELEYNLPLVAVLPEGNTMAVRLVSPIKGRSGWAQIDIPAGSEVKG